MIGKRLIFTLIAGAVLVTVSGLLVFKIALSGNGQESMSEVPPNEQDQVVNNLTSHDHLTESEEEILVVEGSAFEQDSNSTPILQATLQEKSSVDSRSGNLLDVFVTVGHFAFGKNSRTGEELMSKNVKFSDEHVDEDGLRNKRIEVFAVGEYEKQLEVSVIGLQPGEYVFTGEFRDEKGNTYPFSHQLSTSVGSVDVFIFDYRSGLTGTTQRDFFEGHTARQVEPTLQCDYDALFAQLETELVKTGWDMDIVPITKTISTVLDTYPSYDDRELPFGYDEVCAVSIVFEKYFENNMPINFGLRSFWSKIPHDDSLITVGNKQYRSSLADGPMGSTEIRPITTTGQELQLMEMTSLMKVMPVAFPEPIVCPCAAEYTAILTAPMYPSEEEGVE